MRILVGVGSVGGAAAPLRLVRALATVQDPGATVVTVTPWTPAHALLGSAYAVTVHQDAVDVLRATRDDAGLLPVSAREIVDRSVARGLLRAAHEEHADLIVLGGRGRRAIFRATLAERLAARSPCPVATVPRRWGSGAPVLRRIGVLAERGPGGVPALEAAAHLAAASDATLKIMGAIQIAPSVELARERAPEILAPLFRDGQESPHAALDSIEPGVPMHVALRAGRSSELASELPRDLDLVVLGARRWPERSPTIVRRLASRAACPVVFVPPRARGAG
jgi:nucleotide-binding universal stress UspA family protein